MRIRTIEQIMKEDNVGPKEAVKTQEREILGYSSNQSKSVEKETKPVMLDKKWLLKTGTDSSGVYDMRSGSKALTDSVADALKRGDKVTFITDGGKRNVDIVGIKDGMMMDAKKQRWGTFPISSDGTGKEGVLITPQKLAAITTTQQPTPNVTKNTTKEKSIRGPGGKFIKQNVPLNETSKGALQGSRTIQDDLNEKPETRQPIFDSSHLNTGRYPNGRFARTNVPTKNLTNEIMQGSAPMADSVLKQFTDNKINPGKEPRKKLTLDAATEKKIESIQNRNLLLFLGQGFLNTDAPISEQEMTSPEIPTKGQGAPNTSKTYETLVNEQKKISDLNKTPNTSKNTKNTQTLGSSNTTDALLQELVKYTKMNTSILQKLGNSSGHSNSGHGSHTRDPNHITRRDFIHTDSPAFKVGSKLINKIRGKPTVTTDDEEPDVDIKKPRKSKAKSIGNSLLNVSAASATGAGIGGAFAGLSRSLLAIVPEITIGLAGLAAAVAVYKGFADSGKVKERQGMLDDNVRDQVKGNKNVSKFPTNIQNLFSTGSASLEQFNALKDDKEKRKYLESMGASKNDIDEALKNPKSLEAADNSTKKPGEQFGPINRKLMDPGTPNQSSFSILPLGSSTPSESLNNASPNNPTGTTGSATKMPSSSSNSTPNEFYTGIRKELYDAAVKKGLPNPDVVADIGAAQSSIETGYGKHVVGNNYFGIKSGGGVGDGSVSAQTGEHLGGKDVTMNQNFAAFNDRQNSAEGYVDFITKNPRYKGLINAKTKEEGLAALGKSGYATDPNYQSKVGSVIASRTNNSSSLAKNDVTPQITKSQTGPALQQVTEATQAVKQQLNKPQQPVVAQSTPQTTVHASADQPSKNVANVRNDDPTLLSAIRGDIKLS